MDNLNFNCPQYVDFSSTIEDDHSEELIHHASSLEDLSGSFNQESLVEGIIDFKDKEITSSVLLSEEEYVVHAQTTRSQASKKMKKEITIPKPFHFKTDMRLKGKDSANTGIEEKNFASQLRQHEAPTATTCGVTKVKAFKLTENKVQKVEGSYVPFAEQLQAFQKTPDRYRSTAKKEFQPQEHWSPPKLRARTPKLQAVKRHRTVYALSREEEEAKQLEEMKEYQFHAQPIDPRVYKPVLIEKKETKQSTKPQGVDLKTSKRAAAANERSIADESQSTYEFRARPVPKKMLLGPVGLGKKPEVHITKPESPAFSTRKRVEKRKLIDEQNEENAAKKGKIEQKPRQVKKGRRKAAFVRPVPTQIKPFSFDQADKQRYSLKEKKIHEEVEKENKPFVFKAQPIPSPSVSALPKVDKKPITKPEPFRFLLDARGLHDHTVSMKEESFTFKAQPANVLKKEPFVPEKPPKFSIEFKEFELNTDRRASERLRQQELKEVEEREKEHILLARKAIEEENDREEILKLRQDLVHKANPIRQYKTVEIKNSSKPLTEPISPQFATNKRMNRSQKP